ncbi:NADH dehydrogenase 21 kDa subunit [Lenzites betulinus]|nr:NADH dehydrogenase 21 kDa subunit [Lenzites betulinus]
MATRKAAESTLYHLSPKGFWKKFRDVVVINPEISTGLPLPDANRYPQPGSRPEKYATPATKASDPAQNPYWKRDVRRAFPRLSVVTQTELSTLLLDHARAEACVPVIISRSLSLTELHHCSVAAPSEGETSEASSVPVEQQPAVDLTEAIATITSARKAYAGSKLPPTPPIAYPRWRPVRVEDPPHDPHAYFPMLLVK